MFIWARIFAARVHGRAAGGEIELDTSTVEILNQLLVAHSRSLPMYLASARPHRRHGDDKAAEVLAHIVEDQQWMVDRNDKCRFAHNRRLSGFKGLVAFYEELRQIHETALAGLAVKACLRIDVSLGEWSQYANTMRDFLLRFVIRPAMRNQPATLR